MSLHEASRQFQVILDAINRRAATGGDASGIPGAKRSLQWLLQQHGDQSDVYRAQAYLAQMDGIFDAESTVVPHVLKTFETFDEIVSLTDWPNGGDTAFSLWASYPKLQVNVLVTARADYLAFHAAQLATDGRFDEAVASLDNARNYLGAIPANNRDISERLINFTRVFIFHAAQRWGDVLDSAEAATATPPTDQNDPAHALVSAASALASDATAHLGSFEAAADSLEVLAASCGVPSVAAWALMRKGLALRAAGNEKDANREFGRSMQILRFSELEDLQRDTAVTITPVTRAVIDARTSYWDKATEPDVYAFEMTSNSDEREKVRLEALEELRQIHGMHKVKEQIEDMSADVIDRQIRKEEGTLAEEEERSVSNHLVFKGPPGTGKTMIANKIGKLYYGIGVCRNRNFVATDRGGIVGQHEGDSEANMLALCNKARGGVLFIDEAPNIVQNRGSNGIDPFGKAAIAVLLNYMWINRHDIIVIIAGYANDIEAFLATDDGLKSRFPTTIEFVTYNSDELWSIGEGMAERKNLILDGAAEHWFKQVVESMRVASNSSGKTLLDAAGNGRFMDTIINSANKIRARRLQAIPRDQVTADERRTISASDLTKATIEHARQHGVVTFPPLPDEPRHLHEVTA